MATVRGFVFLGGHNRDWTRVTGAWVEHGVEYTLVLLRSLSRSRHC